LSIRKLRVEDVFPNSRRRARNVGVNQKEDH
jgi:hypothetical protein